MAMRKEMICVCISLLICLVILLIANVVYAKYEPTWQSIDARPIPQWYDDAKFGIFMHWGVYTVPGFHGAWMWYRWKGPNPDPDVVNWIKKNYPPDITYADFANQFRPIFYDPKHWADIFKASGAKYVVLTSKHHEGFTNFPSPDSWNWNAMDVGPHQDLVGELVNGVRNNTDIHVGLYYSLFEFFNPLYLADKSRGFTTQEYVKVKPLPDLHFIVNKYKPEVIWSDGDWEASYDCWNSTEFLAWLYNESPVKDTVVTNDRWGKGTSCRHGGYFTCRDRYNPGTLQKRKWENAMTMDRDYWAYRRDITSKDVLTMEELTKTLAQTVSCGGNMLLNVGPTVEGTIDPLFEERLRQMGTWLSVNGEAIYASKPWSHQNDTLTPDVWYTSKIVGSEVVVYAIVLSWPHTGSLVLGSPIASPSTKVSLVGYPGEFAWQKYASGGIQIVIPSIPINKMPCQWAWVFKLTDLAKYGYQYHSS